MTDDTKITSGRCHGPGCTQTADGDFCSERCGKAWSAALADPDHWRERVSVAVAKWAADPEMARRDLGEMETIGVFEAFEGDQPPTFGPLPPAVDGDSEERVCEPSAPDPSRGWLSRTLDRLFGRTT